MLALIWALLIFAFLAAAGMTRYCLGSNSPCYLLDHPNQRSLHDRPTPRGGGMAFLCSLVLAAGIWSLLQAPPENGGWLLAAAVLLAAVGFRDDRGHLAAGYRLLAQALAAALVLTAGLTLQRLALPGWEAALPPALDLLLSLLFIVWMINLYNFMDGMDGLAGGMAVFGFGGLGLLAPALGWFAGFQALVAAAVAGFLIWNLPPARVFMGDLGSSLLGFFAALGLLLAHAEGWLPIWAGLLLFSPFVYDASFTLARRLLRGERVWEAHRSHHYQRLVLAGWSPTRVLLAAYLLMAACLVSVWWSRGLGTTAKWLLLGGWLLVYLGISLGTERLARGRSEVAV
jgi:UDP-N-acetylmuramyl pentapeptide phosphotransferase/UDP-N-acetylglucosamine-1-phosphate transferase